MPRRCAPPWRGSPASPRRCGARRSSGSGSTATKYESGREGEICKIGFSPRKAALTLYGMGIERNAAIVARLGKHSTGKGCLYIKKLADVDVGVLDELIAAAWAG
ncbi:DUF1801 domain-containing protein [Sphingomonas sp.]|uniref:DUF1801 domain-containing protein n=1 Tax=Sphingomonas sp. TaxID=28214 RepID=UPI0034324917